MPKLKVEKDILINATPEAVFRVLSNLGSWRPWNPWLITEPDVQVEVADDGKSYTWKGRRTGEGSMRIVAESPSRFVDLDLTFRTPYKSKSKVAFRIKSEGEGCRVAWAMDGALPFFLFFLKGTMTNLIGMDYDRGLFMLKDFVETGSVPASIELVGEAVFAGCTYVGVTRECAIEELGPKMSEDFIKLTAWAKETSTQLSDKALGVYHKWDLAKGICRYTCAYPVDDVPSVLPAGLEPGRVSSGKVYQIKHVGSYRHRGNAWSTGMQMVRGKEIQSNKGRPPFERYLYMPGEVPEEKQEILVCFPIR